MTKKFFQRQYLTEGSLLFARVILGGIFIVAALFKLPYQTEFIQIVQAYNVLPTELAEMYAVIIPWAELLLGILLVLGLFPRICASLLSLITLSFFIANVHMVQNAGSAGFCGCFGELIPLTHQQSLAMDTVMLIMGISLIVRPSRLYIIRLALPAKYIIKSASVLTAIIMLSMAVQPAVIQATFDDNKVDSTEMPAEEILSATPDAGDERPVLLYFYSDYCSYCQSEKFVIEELEAKYGDRVSFVRFNASDNKDLAREWDIETIPTMILGYSQNITDEFTRFSGLTGKERLIDALDAILAETGPAPSETGPAVPETVTANATRLDSLIETSLINGTCVFLFFHADYCH